ncbi:MAG TPA: LamG domain-containing protein [Methylomirabilota bacterium]|nr:LamG domain-containing protein [Methylomirabilota bacterium]
MTYQPVSYLGFIEGRVVATTAGTAGMIGQLYVFGVPLGDAQMFIAFTDANGDPNPSVCGFVKAAVGPIEFGDVRMAIECPGCVTSFIGAFPRIAGILGEPLLRDVLTRAVPEVDFSGLNTPGMVQAIDGLPPQRRAAAVGAFFATLPTTDPRRMPGNLGELLRDALADTWNAAQPRLIFCGGFDPKLFGFPIPFTPGEARVTGLITKTNVAEGFACSPMSILSYMFQGLLPRLGDRATFAINRPIPDPLGMFITSLDGTLESPERLANFARQQADAALSQLNISVNYEFHPFGLPVADAAARVLLPDVLDHPALRQTPWVSPEVLNPSLPSRADVLVAGATSGQLGDAAGWFGTTADFARIFPPDDPRSNIVKSAGMDLRKHYFPYGGFVGGAQLALPKMLQESPAEWLPLYNTVTSEGDLMARFTAALELLNNHILAVETNGQIAFYLPAPNPPKLTEAARNEGVAAARNLMGTLDASMLVDDLRRFNPTNVVDPNLFPSEVAFFEGRLTGSFLGIPFPDARISARRQTNAHPGAVLTGETIATLSFQTPANSWVGKLAGRALDFHWDIKDTPDTNILGYFNALKAQLEAASNALANAGFAGGPGKEANAGEPTDPQLLLDTVRLSLGTQLPKFAFTNDLPEVTVYPPSQWFPWPVNPYVSVPVPLFDPRVVALTADLDLFGFSPGYAPDTPLDGPLSVAMRSGGFAAKGRLLFLPLTTSPFGVDDAELSVTAETVNGLTVPRLTGRLRGLTAPPLFPGFLFEDIDADFDTHAPTFLRLHKDISGVTIGPVIAWPISGNAINTDLEFHQMTPAGQFPSLNVSLSVDPLQLQLPLIEPRLALHGAGGLNQRIVLGPEQLSAAGELREVNGNTANFLEVRAPGEPTVTLVRVSNLPVAGFAIAGQNLGDFTATAHADLSGAVQVALLPGISMPNPFGQPGDFTLPTLALPGNGTFALSVKSDGTFSLRGELDSAVGPFAAGASVTVDNNSAQIAGQINGAQGTLNIDLLHRTSTFSASVTLLGPLCAFDNRICLRGTQPDGRIAFAVTPNGLCASGVELKLVGFHPNGGDLSVTLGQLCLEPNNVFNALQPEVRPDGIKLGPFELTGLDQFQVSGDFRQGRLTVQMGGGISVAGVLTAGFDAVLNQDGFNLNSRGDSLNVLGFNFVDGESPVSLSASGRFKKMSSFMLHFTGQLAVPFATFQFQGDIPANGAFTLQPTVRLENLTATPDFPLKDVLPLLKYGPGDYRAMILGDTPADAPAGYWRLADGDGIARDERAVALKRNGSYQGGVNRQVEGAFGSSGNTAAEFNGSDGYVRIPPTGLTPTNAAGFTVEFWFRRTTGGDLQCPFVFCAETLAAQAGAWNFALYGSSISPEVYLGWNLSGLTTENGAGDLNSQKSFRDTEWHHIVGTWDGFIQSLYVDGQLEAWQRVLGQPLRSSGAIGLAAFLTGAGDADSFFSGRLDDVAIYQRALSPVEVADHWAAAGRGSLRLEGRFNFFGQGNGAEFQGVLNPDGGWAVELSSSAAFSLPELDQFGPFGLSVANADARVAMLHTANGMNVVSVNGQAQLPGLLGGGMGQRLRAVATSPNDFLFQVEHHGDLGNISLPFHLDRLRVERINGGAPDAKIEGKLSLPFQLGDVSITGTFSGNSFNLQNPSAVDVVAGPAQFTFAANALYFSPQLVDATGSLRIGGSSVAAGGRLHWQSGGAFQLTALSDTGWEAVRIHPSYIVCPCLNGEPEVFAYCPCGTQTRYRNYTILAGYQRLKWNLDVQRQNNGGWDLKIGGIFAATLLDGCSRPQNLNDFPGQCILPWLKVEGEIGVASGDGTFPVLRNLQGIPQFNFDLW